MDEQTKKWLTLAGLLVVFAISVALVVIGQQHVGAPWLGLQMVGIAGLVFLLWNYNRKFK